MMPTALTRGLGADFAFEVWGLLTAALIEGDALGVRIDFGAAAVAVTGAAAVAVADADADAEAADSAPIGLEAIGRTTDPAVPYEPTLHLPRPFTGGAAAEMTAANLELAAALEPD